MIVCLLFAPVDFIQFWTAKIYKLDYLQTIMMNFLMPDYFNDCTGKK
jgi:hypothetical protein